MMEKKIQQLIIDLAMFSIGLALTIAGVFLTDGIWLVSGVILVAIPVIRSKGLGSFSKISGINNINIDVNIEKEACMGVGSCVAIAPQVFKIDEASLKSSFMAYAPLEVLDKKGASNQTILEAAQSCPYKAIIVEDKDSNEQIFP
jgi:ferredoxin|tara:strand:- start:81 stop:515 length:435 start_codon:yes stop_codon:yes gene_type:complete